MAMRAQLSLQFDDRELFDDFITPYKEGRMLNSLIIKCLSAYYYNEEVRNLIEGTSMEDVANNEAIQSTQSICDSIRASLLMQDFLASELQNTIDNGLEDIDNILNQTNDVAKKSGVARSTESEYGSNLLRISMQEASDVVEKRQKSAKVTDRDSLELLINAVLKLAEASGNKEVVDMLQSDDIDESIVSSETIISNNEIEVSIDETSAVEEFTSHTNKTEFVSEMPIPEANDFDIEFVEVQSSSSEDATDAIADLLGSL